MNRKATTLAASLAALAFLLAGCNDVVTGKVISNGVQANSCTADATKPVSLGVETNEVDDQAQGGKGTIIKVVCLSEAEAAQYPRGSTYPNK